MIVIVLTSCDNNIINSFPKTTNIPIINDVTHPKLNFDEIYKKANEKLKNSKSYQINGNIDGNQGKSSIKGTIITNAISPELDMLVSSNAGNMRMIISNGYMYVQDTSSDNKWIKVKINDKTMNQMGLINYNSLVDLINIGNNQEVIDNNTNYLLKVNGVEQNKLLEYISTKNNLLGLSATESDNIRNFYKLDKLQMELSINKENFQINNVKGSYNIAISSINDKTLSNFIIDVKYSNYNEVEKLDIPLEAKDALEIK